MTKDLAGHFLHIISKRKTAFSDTNLKVQVIRANTLNYKSLICSLHRQPYCVAYSGKDRARDLFIQIQLIILQGQIGIFLNALSKLLLTKLKSALHNSLKRFQHVTHLGTVKITQEITVSGNTMSPDAFRKNLKYIFHFFYGYFSIQVSQFLNQF